MTQLQKTESIQITVVIPAYNIEQYIERAIDSVLAQSRPADEIIVVDDGSKDQTAEKIKRYGDKIRYVFQENRGLSGARNTGIRQANYDWIAFLDGDDQWLADHLKRQAELLVANPHLRWSGANFICCLCEEDRRGESVTPSTVKTLMKGKDYFECFFDAHAHRVAGHPDTMIIHREVFEKVGTFNEDQAFAEDLEMWWRIAFEFPQIGYIAEPTAVYHLQRPGTLSEEFRKTRHQWLITLLEKNRKRAVEKEMTSQFDPLVTFLVTSWIRGLLFENRPGDIKELLVKFSDVLPGHFMIFIRVLMMTPALTARVCHMLSVISRYFKLRKKITRQPGDAGLINEDKK